MATKKVTLRSEIQAGFAQINARFDGLEEKVDANHSETTELFGAVKRDFDRLDDRMGSLETKVKDIDNRLASVEVLAAKNEHHFHELDLNMNKRFSDMDKCFLDMDKRFDHLEVAVFPKTNRRLSLAV